MVHPKGFWHGVTLVVGSTVGAGVFALPAIFAASGWALGIFYLALLGGIIIFTHTIYLKVLKRVNGEHRLLGLARIYFGPLGFYFALLTMIGGLSLALVAYLSLGARFLMIIFPVVPAPLAPFLFWLLASLPLILRSRPASVEFLGSGLMATGILFVFFTTPDLSALFRAIPTAPTNVALPFGAILFALAGWPAVEPLYELWREKGSSWNAAKVLAIGTSIAALLYIFFVMGIFGSGSEIASDTISGLTSWTPLKLLVLGFVGLCALWTCYMPIGVEMRTMIEKDLGVRMRHAASVIVVMLPLTLLLLGLKNFITIVGLSGGIFLAAQYFLILAVGAKALGLRSWRLALVIFSMGAFFLAAFYELMRPLL